VSLPGGDLVVVHDDAQTLWATRPVEVVEACGDDALDFLDRLSAGWWAGWISYDLGRAIERVPTLATNGPLLPDLCLARFERPEPLSPGVLEPSGHSRQPASTIRWGSSLDRTSWEGAIARIHGHLEAGDCYQVNLTRRLESETPADAVELFRSVRNHNPAPHDALIRIGDVSVVSASPERFLRRDGSRIETRPIKGTSGDPAELAASSKDHAENVMIVDLSRNDLGRICEYGTVEVPSLCEMEAHPGLYHLVSTVRGRLRPGVTPGDIIRATFPPASVTGCPKPRVLQIIENLEPVRRGAYCGAVGFIDADRNVMDLNVAIRTFTLTPDRTYFGVGGGIVADSDAGAEWEETELKARRLLRLAEGNLDVEETAHRQG
jgi:para-aminobenzoate synthetase component I